MGEAEAGLAVVPGIRLTDRIGIGVLTRLIDRDLIDDVLAETGRAGQRSGCCLRGWWSITCSAGACSSVMHMRR